MTQEHERRSFFRIHGRLVVEFRQITAENFIKLKDIIQYNSIHTIYKNEKTDLPSDKDLKGENRELHAYMKMINKKLDAIIGMLSQSQHSETYHAVQKEINLSGSGVQFETRIALQVGDYTELKLIVPIFPYPRITALCQVVRTENLQEDMEGISRIAMKFLVIHEKDRDLLINYIFEKEREYLRQKNETVS